MVCVVRVGGEMVCVGQGWRESASALAVRCARAILYGECERTEDVHPSSQSAVC